MAKEILTLQGLSKYYTGAHSVVIGLDRIDLSFRVGEFVAITGESGSGKSTLAHVLGGILPYEAGELLVEGRPTSHYDGTDWERYRRDKISFISQSYGILLGCTVLGNVTSALRLTGMDRKDARREAETILKKVELWELRSRRAAKLSSGQKQRLSIARALAKPAPILLADEPTGNLDEENSAKVISLLADAAKERLVLLITHEISEVEDCATRRICLQDGVVTMDAQLRPAAEAAPRKRPVKKPKHLSSYIAGLQLRAQPIWSAMMLLFFALTAFAVFAFLGTFIVSLDDTHTRIYDRSAFYNGDPVRIAVVKEDGSEMTQEDADALLNVNYVERIERYGYIRDIGCFYLPEEHYHLNTELINIGSKLDPIYETSEVITLRSTAYFLQTAPLMQEGESFLTEGRLPKNIYEVVSADSRYPVGSTLPVYLRNQKDWNSNVEIHLEVTVVGATDTGYGLYFHDNVGRMFTCVKEAGLSIYGANPAVTDDTAFLCNFNFFTTNFHGYSSPDGKYPAMMFSYREGGTDPKSLSWDEWAEHTHTLLYGGLHNSSYPYYFEVSPATFEKLVPEGWGNQFSLTIENYAYTDRVIEEVKALGYAAVSPYREGSTEVDPEKAAERSQTLFICVLALIVILALQVVVLKAMYAMKHESYKLLSNIGLDCRTAKRSILLQFLIFTLLGQSLGLGGIVLGTKLGIERIAHVTRYLPLSYILVLSVVHLLATVISAALVMGALRKQVYPFAARETDLALGEEVEA